MEKYVDKNRVALWDNIKFILVVFVVIGHFVDIFCTTSEAAKSIYLFIYAFHMPLFIFIAGLFHREKNISKRVLFFITVGLVNKIFIMIFDVYFNNSKPKFSLLSEDFAPWFMIAIAAYIMLTHLLKDTNKKCMLLIWIFIACFIGYDKAVSDYLCLSRIIIFFPFYFLGSIISSNPKREVKKNKLMLCLSCIILIVWALFCLFDLKDVYILRHLFTGRNPFDERILYYGPLVRLGCYVLSILLCWSIIMLTPSKKM